MTRNQRKAALFAGLFTAAYAGACLYLWATQVDKIFMPVPTMQTTPGRMGMAYEEVSIPVGGASERGRVQGYWIPSGGAAAPTFLYFHGNKETIGKSLEHVQRLHQMGYHVLMIDYRGYGRSFGKERPSEAKVYEDAEAGWTYLTQTRGLPPRQIFLYGHSLGGAIAIELATRHPDAAGLVTESTFTSVLEVAKRRYFGLLRMLPVNLLLEHRFESLRKIGRLRLPVLFIHGTWDATVPYTMSQELFRAAPEPKKLLLIEHGEHANSASIGWVEYKAALTAFVQAQDRRWSDAQGESPSADFSRGLRPSSGEEAPRIAE